MGGKSFQNIVLIGRAGVSGVSDTLDALYNYLISLKCNISVGKHTSTLMNINPKQVVTKEKIPSDTDLVIVVGGDGSLLNAARVAIKHRIPILGINRGRLGFLTDIHPNELIKVGDVIKGEYREETRFLLNASLVHKNKIIKQDIALNDVVLLPGEIVHMIEFEIYVDNIYVCSQRADGLIVATPTGSTAYALSGGGPILHPELNAIALVPMFPHTLSSRPIVINGEHHITIKISATNEASPYVSCDGLSRDSIPPEGEIIIKKHHDALRLIHPTDYTYYQTLREKLGWQHHPVRS